MTNKETKTRVANAFRAMKAIGISEDKVKPVLKSLLKLFDKNWSLIEEENYRALADAIFEREELDARERSQKIANDEAAEQSKKIVNTQTGDCQEKESEGTEEQRPLKRLRHKHQDGQTSSLNRSDNGIHRTPLVIPKEEPGELPESVVPRPSESNDMVKSPQPNEQNAVVKSPAVQSQSVGRDKGKQPMSAESLTINDRGDPGQPINMSRNQQKTPVGAEPRLQSHSMRLRESTGVVSPQTSSKEKRSAPDSSARDLCLKEPKVEPGIILSSPEKIRTENHALIKPKDEPITDDMTTLEVHVVSHAEPSQRGELPTRNASPESLPLQSLREKGTPDGASTPNQPTNESELPIISGGCSSNIEIVSSPEGEVRISLSCNLGSEMPDFHMPSLEEVLKSVEDKYLRSIKSLDPSISVMNIMKEICQSFMDLGTNSSCQPSNNIYTHPINDSMNKHSAAGDPGVGCLVDSHSGATLPEPQATIPPPPCSSVFDAAQPNKMDGEDEIVTDREKQENCAQDTNCLSLVVVQNHQVIPEITASCQDAVDISKGQEKVAITLVNEVNDELPPSFFYIPQNAAFQNAYVNFSLARIGDSNCCASCSGDCLLLSTPCACAHELGGEFAYTSNGLVKEEFLKECVSMNRDSKKHCQFFCKECPLERSKCQDSVEPCKGHLVRKFIKECWLKCGCNKQCGNRVVQRGISCNLQVFMTPGGKGWGLRTLEDLPKGAFVCEYVGEVLTNAELFERVLRSPQGEKHSYPVLLDADWGAEAVLKDDEALCLDATYYGNLARFINHRCYDSNLVEIPVEVETPDHHYYHLAFFTTRKVKAMEELTWDYGIDFDDHEHPIKAFQCQCGSKFCRNIKRSRSRGGRS